MTIQITLQAETQEELQSTIAELYAIHCQTSAPDVDKLLEDIESKKREINLLQNELAVTYQHLEREQFVNAVVESSPGHEKEEAKTEPAPEPVAAPEPEPEKPKPKSRRGRKKKAALKAVEKPNGPEEPIDRTVVKDKLLKLINKPNTGGALAKELLIEFNAMMFSDIRDEQLPLFVARLNELST